MVGEGEVVHLAGEIVEAISINHGSLRVEALEALELRNRLHNSALTTHEARGELVVTGAGLLAFGAAPSGFTAAGGDAAASPGGAGVAINL